METRFEEEKGWNPLGNTKQEREKPQITMAAGREERGRKRVDSGLETGQWGFVPMAPACPVRRPDLSSRMPDWTRLVKGPVLSGEIRNFRLGTNSRDSDNI
jgi:hypothetical protein